MAAWLAAWSNFLSKFAAGVFGAGVFGLPVLGVEDVGVEKLSAPPVASAILFW